MKPYASKSLYYIICGKKLIIESSRQNLRNSLKKKLNYFYYFGKNLTFYLFAISSRLSYNQNTETTYCDYTYPAKQNDDNDKRGNYFSYHLSQ